MPFRVQTELFTAQRHVGSPPMNTIETVWKVSTKIIRPRSKEFRFWKNPKLPISSRISSVSITEGLPTTSRPLPGLIWPLPCHVTQCVTRDRGIGPVCDGLWSLQSSKLFLFAKHKQRIFLYTTMNLSLFVIPHQKLLTKYQRSLRKFSKIILALNCWHNLANRA